MLKLVFLSLPGHVQVAQVPDRHEPDSEGEVQFGYVFKLLKNARYEGFIGCEYLPKGNTEHGLAWIGMYDLEQ